MIGERVTRPWGCWQVLDVGEGFKVKRITVRPQSRLAYETHEHRAEHWAVVSGTATCVVDGKVRLAGPGESVDVAAGQPHRITNLEDEELVLIEVQTGRYTGEDDVCAVEDGYGRSA
ncbi:phosphomannose isomerase type II C-terminal cupin domain [Nocardioides marmotae]|uniref:phosphomannose isomerase type II C-terminal cupin domain n=1 Tax=Nocardioides marmotae TaxID=2663857 RepID=UPI0012B66898|nr:phosphomannose isomerase type II C-terminal cupin domain [Nocardioides marmotae]MBC9735298.1 phosphomannose isomerase type II C-terminal cupin domain [Nocardioides marmotae]MTB86398.1 cupin domain-containing protein [Nocardioides marmotae]